LHTFSNRLPTKKRKKKEEKKQEEDLYQPFYNSTNLSTTLPSSTNLSKALPTFVYLFQPSTNQKRKKRRRRKFFDIGYISERERGEEERLVEL